jgi:hypothetical protein
MIIFLKYEVIYTIFSHSTKQGDKWKGPESLSSPVMH